MHLIINGSKLHVPQSVGTVSELLSHLGLDQKIVIVELNRHILDKSLHRQTTITDGDTIEMVHFVGGG